MHRIRARRYSDHAVAASHGMAKAEQYREQRGAEMRRFAIFLMVLAVMALSCDAVFTTSISKIIENPRDYDGKTVTISGEVTDSYSLLVVKYFTVDDGKSSITVVTQRSLPKKGTRIRVKGKVNTVFALGDTQSTVIVEDDDKK